MMSSTHHVISSTEAVCLVNHLKLKRLIEILCDFDYERDRSSPDHTPAYSCTITFRVKDEAVTLEATSTNKKNAKAEVCLLIVQVCFLFVCLVR